MKKYFLTYTATILLSLGTLTGCGEFLETKTDSRLAIPTTLEDYRALLNTFGIMNNGFCASGEVSADDFYLSDADFNGLYYESDKRLYTYMPDYVSRPQSSAGNEWYTCYQPIYVCNSVLHGLQENNLIGSEADNLRGQALVFRAARLLDGAQLWAPAYDRSTAMNDLGMVLRLDPDMNLPSVRSTVEETYVRITDDLTEATGLLPTTQPNVTLPSKATALALLARIYLFMADYPKALSHALEALEFTSELIDFNGLNLNANYPIPAVNGISAETTFHCPIYGAAPLNNSRAKISPELYDLYDDDDLRKQAYFRLNDDGSYRFKGSHSRGAGNRAGVTVGELYLIVAECYARGEELDKAADALNTLSEKRWRSNAFVPYHFDDRETALQTVLLERRKELTFRGLRWADIKRLNRDGANITLSRTVNGQIYTLPARDLRFTLPIPEEVVEITGITQNPR